MSVLLGKSDIFVSCEPNATKIWEILERSRGEVMILCCVMRNKHYLLCVLILGIEYVQVRAGFKQISQSLGSNSGLNV